MRSVNPTTGAVLREYAAHSPAEATQRLERAAAAFPAWRATPPERRAAVLDSAARVLRARRDALANLATLEMGKPIAAAEAEVEKCAWVCEHYAAHGPAALAPEPAATDAARSFVRFDPLGVLLAIMPWNFPYWQLFRAAAPALLAGNVVALKHASNVCGCALAIEAVWREAGLPAGAFTTLLVPGGEALALVDHPAVAAVTLTGSEAAGIAVAARAGAALKKTVLELGGSDPFVVLADADLPRTVAQAVIGRVQNNGQSCIAAKRFIVEAPVAEAFESRLRAALATLVMGDPLARTTDVGPLARADLVDELDRQVRASVAAGAHLALGGVRPAGPGCFYPPTLLTGVRPGMAAFDEETFGPLAAVTRARDTAEAVALANASRFGLGASVWTADAARGEALAAELEAGCVFVNGIVKSDPRLPFGGVRRSGYGRELGTFGLREFVNVKTVWEARA